MEGQIARGLRYLNHLCQKAVEDQLQGQHMEAMHRCISGSWHEISREQTVVLVLLASSVNTV